MSGNYPTGGPGQSGQGGQQGGQGQGGFGRPSGPGFGGSGGPQQGGPQQGGPYQGGPQQRGPQQGGPYRGQPGPGYPGGPSSYGSGGQPPQSWGQAPNQPGQPGQGPRGPQGPYGPYPGQPGQPGQGQPQKKSSKLPIIIGAGALVLVLIIVGSVIALTRGSKEADPGGGGGTNGGGGGSTSAPAAATKASDAVKGYLDALAAGNADQALGYASTEPADKTFLTSQVLAASLKAAPITAINVPEVADEYAYQVSASYKLGSQTVNDDYYVSKSGDTWKIKEGWAEVSLSSIKESSLPLLISGVAAKTDKVLLFPGSYAMTTGSEYVSYGSGKLVVTSPEAYPSTSDLDAKLTSAGSTAFKNAVISAAESCMKQKKAKAGCGLEINPPSGAKPRESTIKWKFASTNPLKNINPRLDYSNPSVATAYLSGLVRVTYSGSYKGREYDFTGSEYLDTPRVTMTAKPLKVRWND